MKYSLHTSFQCAWWLELCWLEFFFILFFHQGQRCHYPKKHAFYTDPEPNQVSPRAVSSGTNLFIILPLSLGLLGLFFFFDRNRLQSRVTATLMDSSVRWRWGRSKTASRRCTDHMHSSYPFFLLCFKKKKKIIKLKEHNPVFKEDSPFVF